jgi:hypothetical protein
MLQEGKVLCLSEYPNSMSRYKTWLLRKRRMFAFACCQGYHFTWHCLSHPITVQPQWISEYLSKEQPLTLVGSKKCSGTGSCFLKESSQVWCILGCAFCMLFGSYCASSWEDAGILNATLPILCFDVPFGQVGQALLLFPMRKDMQLTLSCCQNWRIPQVLVVSRRVALWALEVQLYIHCLLL